MLRGEERSDELDSKKTTPKPRGGAISPRGTLISLAGRGVDAPNAKGVD